MIIMHKYLVIITMPDGSRGQHHGLYASGFDAIVCAIGVFGEARRISARRLP